MMNESTNGENSPIVSMFDSSRLSQSTGGGRSTNSNMANELVELKRRLRDLESENLEMKRAIPHLKDAKGDDCTEWAVKITNELEEQKEKYRLSQDKLASMAKDHREYQEATEKQIGHAESAIQHYKNKAQKLEEETEMLRDRLRDEQSMNYHLQHDDHQQGREPTSVQSGENNQQEFEDALRHIDQHSEADDLQSGRSTARPDRPDSSRSHELAHITLYLFNKLRSTASFFMHLLDNIGTDPKDTELIQRIQSLNLDLNRSIEMYNRKMQELRQSVPNSAESSFHSNQHEQQREGTSDQQPLHLHDVFNCQKCKSVENERDALRAQLNREIGMKEDQMATNDELERNLREMRRRMEELRGELHESQNKVEDIERKLKRTEEHYRGRYDWDRSNREAELQAKVTQLRQWNMEVDAKNEEILKNVCKYKELIQEDLNKKDIELQRMQSVSKQWQVQYLELKENYQQMEERIQSDQDIRLKLEEQLQKREAQLRTYVRKVEKLRQILASYGHYFDKTVEYEQLVEKSTQVLEEKLREAQRSASSHSNLAFTPSGSAFAQQNPNQNNHHDDVDEEEEENRDNGN